MTSCKVVEGVLHALAAKSAIAPILSTLLPLENAQSTALASPMMH
jgi:hypothetical protein